MLETVNQEEAAPAAVDVLTTETTNDVLDVAGTDPEEIVDSMTVGEVENAEATSDGNLISVRLNRVGLEEAINLFAQLSGANIIVPELAEAAQISVNLKDVEWRPALQSILDTYNYELYQRVSGSNVYSVRRRPAGSPEPQVVETFKLEYATVPNAAKLIRDLIPAEAKISEFASRNILVVKSTESSLSEVRAVLAAIDKVRQQVFIESKFMELTDDAQKDLGINWTSLQSYDAGVALSTSAYGFENANGSPTENLWNDMVGGSASAAGSGEYTVLTSVLDADEFAMTLSALEQNKGVNIVSNPKIIVANEEMANISIIRKEPNLKQEREQQLNDQEATTTYTLDESMPWFEYGIKLDVTPSINTSSNITVQIQPSLTRKFADKEAGDNTYPIIDEKSIDTVFNLASGETAAIGGLTEITESEEEHRVPLLGSIPLLGRLFSWKQTVSGQDETIIFVTVGLANTEQLKEGIDMPEDAELARRQLILDAKSKQLRDYERDFFENQEQEKLDDMMKILEAQEAQRLQKRQEKINKEAAKKAQLEA
ncbi:hypothetical protein [Pontiella sp.]|uniref:hypothetical protein n=1 Tax=Pontiella sp. TaxID=2837462 RepID=UPI00356B0E6C